MVIIGNEDKLKQIGGKYFDIVVIAVQRRKPVVQAKVA